MIQFSDLQIQVTLTVEELYELVAMVNLGAEHPSLAEAEVPGIVAEISRLYFELVENLKDGILGDFEPE